MQKSKGSLLARALKELSLVFSKNSSTLFSGNSDKSLFESCQVVADKMGFSLVSMAESLATIDQICRHSNIQHRKVNLKSHWWEKDHGHLIGYNKEKKQYIPLLRSNKSNYYTIDPISLKHIAIDACNAEEIADQACSIYHPLPKYCGRFIALLATVFKKNLREYRLIGIAGAVGIVLSFFIPLANKVFFDYVIPNYDFDVFYQVFLGLIVFTVTSAIFGFTRSIVLLRLNGVISNRLQLSLWDRLLKLPVSFFRSMPIGDLLQRTLIFEEIRDNLSQNTVKIIFNGVFSSIYLVIMFLYSWQLALAGVIIIFLSTCVTAVVFLMRLHYERIILRSSAIIHAFLIQATRGIVKIRIANVESTIFSIWAKKFSYNQSQRLKSQNLQNIVNTSTETFNLLTSLVIFAIVAFFQGESSQAFTVGQYLAFIAAFGPFSFATFEFLNTVTSLVSMIPLWERVQPILTVPVERKKGALDPGELKGAISIKNLDFRYGHAAPLVLNQFSCEIAPGEFIGIVGSSGSGKSTLCRLLIGFEKVHAGSILYDQKNLIDIDLEIFRSQVSTLFQSGGIFQGSLYDNIICGMPCSAEEIQKALELSTFIHELEELPMGLDTIISSGGGLISGGQRQKLLLTRALLRKPKILILDEALNSVDNQARVQILDNLETLNITRIITAHNLNTFRKADRILVLDGGTITDRGNFEELSKKEGLFQRYLEKQQI